MLDVDPMDQEYPNSVAEARASPEWPDWEKAVKTEHAFGKGNLAARRSATWTKSDWKSLGIHKEIQ
jgi:hypothetical protein